MTSHSNGERAEPTSTAFVNRQPIGWITAVADQVARETGLARTADIDDLVIIAYVGLLDSPSPAEFSQSRLLQQCRHDLVTWAWEQGVHDETIPITAQRTD